MANDLSYLACLFVYHLLLSGSYNAINGTPACLSPLLRAARKQWGFEQNNGYVTSDTDAVANAWYRWWWWCSTTVPSTASHTVVVWSGCPAHECCTCVIHSTALLVCPRKDHHYVATAAEASCLAITQGGDQINSGMNMKNAAAPIASLEIEVVVASQSNE